MTHGSPLDVYPIEMKTHIHMKPRVLMSTAASLAIITPWTQAQRPPVGGWMNVLGFSHTMGWYLAIERNQVLTRVKTGTAFNNTMLREGSPRMIWFHVHEGSITDKYSPRRDWLRGCQGLAAGGWGKGCGSCQPLGKRFLSGMMRLFRN